MTQARGAIADRQWSKIPSFIPSDIRASLRFSGIPRFSGPQRVAFEFLSSESNIRQVSRRA
jgi:hypothetical protein